MPMIIKLTCKPNPMATFPKALHNARSCYGHFAGKDALTVIDAMGAAQLLARHADDGFRLTSTGVRWVMTWHCGASESTLLAARGKACLDRTERRAHVGSALGRVLLGGWISAGWLARTEMARQVVVTPMGRHHFQASLGVRMG